jgi:hypothetical protein
MAIQIPQAPNLTVQQPAPVDALGNYAKMAQLKDMLGRQALLPLQVQEQQQVNQQRQMAIQEGQIGLQNAQSAQSFFADPDKYTTAPSDTSQASASAGTAAPSGATPKPGFAETMLGLSADDPLTKYMNGLVRAGVHPTLGNNSAMSIGKGLLDFRKTVSQATEEQQKVTSQGLATVKEILTPIAAETDLAKRTQMLNDAKPELLKASGFDPTLHQAIMGADAQHIPAIVNMTGATKEIVEYGKAQGEAAEKTAKGEQAVRAAAPVTSQQLTNAVTTLNTYNAVPPNMRTGLASEMKNAPDWETLQKVQSRADAANESFQRSDDARQQAMALKDVGLQQVVAGKLVAEDQKLGSALDQTSGIRGLLDMSKGGNQAATAAALTRFAEHEIVEGGVKRMNQLEYENLATKLGSYGRKFQSWVDGGFKGQMPAATNSEIHTILDSEDTAANAVHERNVGYVMDRYAKPQTQAGGAKPAPPRASGQRPPLSSFENSHAQ